MSSSPLSIEHCAPTCLPRRCFSRFVRLTLTYFLLIFCLAHIVFSLVGGYVTVDTVYALTFSHPSASPSIFTVPPPGTGRATFQPFGYNDQFPMRNYSTLDDGATRDTDTSITTHSTFAISCRYSVFTHLIPTRHNAWREYDFYDRIGDESTLTAPHCAALNTFRVAVVLFNAPLFALFLVLLGAQCRGLDRPRQILGEWQPDSDASAPPRSTVTALAVAEPSPLIQRESDLCATSDVDRALDSHHLRSDDDDTPPRRAAASLSCAWSIVVVLVITAGVISVAAMWPWIRGRKWVNPTAGLWPIVMTVLQPVLWLLLSGLMTPLITSGARKEMAVLRELDPSVDVTLWRWSCGCCRARRQRYVDGHEQPLLC